VSSGFLELEVDDRRVGRILLRAAFAKTFGEGYQNRD